MPEEPSGTEILSLGQDFPPVSTAEWEAAIQRDLKGADYQKRLVWRTEEAIAVQPYYRKEALAGLEGQTQTVPGVFPFVRGTGKAWEAAQEFQPGPDAIRADLLHEAGAHAVQELGMALAAGVDRFAEHPDAEIEFVFAVGSNYFFEIAKLRAARMLWAQASAAFGERAPRRMRLHVRTSRQNKSIYDRYTNLLRVTTEALSAAIGGCDRLTIEPFGFDAHLALNVHRILKEEAHMDAVADPAGGCYYVEALTDALAREAWKLFQQIEAWGGYAKAIESGFIEKALAQSRAAREKLVSSRRRNLVGVNNYPNLQEKTPEAEAPAPLKDAPFPMFRLAEPFEKIRERTTRHARTTGRHPRVLLLTRGDLKMRKVRANFSLNFFGCAGFDVFEAEEYAGTEADLVVLCSSDSEYLVFAQEVVPKLSVPVIVAGNPKEQADALRAAGVQGFIHIQSDAVQTLTEWQDRLGMKE